MNPCDRQLFKFTLGSLFVGVTCAWLLFVTGCRAPHNDPPLFTFSSPIELRIASELHKRDIGGKLYRATNTHSMEPLIMGGDVIVIDTRSAFTKALLGFPVTYRAAWQPAPAAPVTHRLVAWDASGAIAEGDNVSGNTNENKSRVTAKNYIGVVVGIYRMR